MKTKEKFIRHNHNHDGLDRRGFLECMAWAGTGMLWAGAGGALASGILRPANAVAAEAKPTVAADFTFVQISDSHIGFNKEANKDVAATLREAVAKINALPKAPSFMLHTGDLTHLAEAEEFDTPVSKRSELFRCDIWRVKDDRRDGLNPAGATVPPARLQAPFPPTTRNVFLQLVWPVVDLRRARRRRPDPNRSNRRGN